MDNTNHALNVNVVAGGAAGGTSSSFGAAFPGSGTAAGAKDNSGNMAALNLDASGFLKVNVAAGSGGNGAASNTNAAVPTQADYLGVKVGANLQGVIGFDLDNSGTTHEYSLGVNLRKIANGGSAETGILATPLRIDPTGTTTQPVSGTVTANQGGAPWSDNITQIAGASIATAAAGIAKVGVTDGSGNAINSTSNALNVAVTTTPKSSTASAPAQTATGTDAVVLAANSNRKKFIIQNTGAVVVKIGYGAAATATAYTFALAPCATADDGSGGYKEDDMYTGAIHAFSASAGAIVITELT